MSVLSRSAQLLLRMIGMNRKQSLAQLATEHPAAVHVMYAQGLDYGNGGRRTLEEACSSLGVDAEEVLAELTAASDASHTRWDQAPVSALITNILERYHEGHRAELPRLIELALQVESEGKGPHLAEFLVELSASMESHLQKEEQVLFPLILAGRGPMAHMPVQVMMMEHNDHGENLDALRERTDDLTTPPDASDALRKLYEGLRAFEAELIDHIHLENNILFPRALAGSR